MTALSFRNANSYGPIHMMKGAVIARFNLTENRCCSHEDFIIQFKKEINYLMFRGYTYKFIRDTVRQYIQRRKERNIPGGRNRGSGNNTQNKSYVPPGESDKRFNGYLVMDFDNCLDSNHVRRELYKGMGIDFQIATRTNLSSSTLWRKRNKQLHPNPLLRIPRNNDYFKDHNITDLDEIIHQIDSERGHRNTMQFLK